MQEAKPRAGRIATALVVGVVGLQALIMPLRAAAATEGWMVNGAMLSGSEGLATLAQATNLTITAANGLKLKCNAGTINVVHGEIKAPSGGGVESLAFHTCEAENAECNLASSSIATVQTLFELTLDGSLAARGTISPESKVIATFKYEGVNCAFSGVQALSGKLGLLMPEGRDERTVQNILVDDEKKLTLAGGEGRLHVTISAKGIENRPWSYL
jgi:hypothetical protein